MKLSTAEEITRRAYYRTLDPWVSDEMIRRARRIMAGKQQPYPPHPRKQVVIVQSVANFLKREQSA